PEEGIASVTENPDRERAHEHEVAVVDARTVDQRDVDAPAFEVAQLVKAVCGHWPFPCPPACTSRALASPQTSGTGLRSSNAASCPSPKNFSAPPRTKSDKGV